MQKALYRKYRPTSLADVVGQNQVVTALQNSLKQGKISHAYLFTGPRGTGKTSIARIFAHAVNHFDYQLEDEYIDIIEIDAASNTGVDNIRELREKAVIAPTKGQYKIYIIDEIHMLSKSAFNALLKTLEEPPEHVIFIMATTDPQKVPITITSRAQNYQFSLATPDTMKTHLQAISKKENIPISDEALDIIVKRGGGSFRDSISLLDQISNLSTDQKEITAATVTEALGLPQDQKIQTLLALYQKNNFSAISAAVKDLLSTGAKPETIAEEILNQILENPQKEYLPLLATLPEVKPPFPEAKLLLAILGQPQPQTPQTAKTWQPPAPAASSPVKTSVPNRPHSFTPAPPRVTPAPQSTASQPATPPPQSTSPQSVTPLPQSVTPQSPTTDTATSTNAPFSWESFLSKVQQSSTLLYNILAKSNYAKNGQTLELYVKNKGIIEATNNKALLTRLAGLQIVAKDPTAYKNTTTYGKISDIMGNVEEVTDPNGNPFQQ